MTTPRTKLMKDEIEDIIKAQEASVEDLKSKESQSWDIKFQNYWGQIVAADANGNYEQTIKMCEKLFQHIGQFREHATEQVIKIVETMHNPKEKTLLHKPLTQIEEDKKVLMDEDDNTLYVPGPGKREIEEKSREGM